MSKYIYILKIVLILYQTCLLIMEKLQEGRRRILKHKVRTAQNTQNLVRYKTVTLSRDPLGQWAGIDDQRPWSFALEIQLKKLPISFSALRGIW
jgi:hypothetical protein